MCVCVCLCVCVCVCYADTQWQNNFKTDFRKFSYESVDDGSLSSLVSRSRMKKKFMHLGIENKLTYEPKQNQYKNHQTYPNCRNLQVPYQPCTE